MGYIMILVVGGIKGGCGKTTIATNLTVLRASKKRNVLLIDADEQRSASDWAEEREGSNAEIKFTTIQLGGRSINNQIERMKDSYDDIIIDVGGRDTTSQRSALSIADIFLVPFKPRSLDIWTIGSLRKLISEIQAVNRKLKCYAFINQADSRGSDNSDALKVISECCELICLEDRIGNRKSFCNAASHGLGVIELKCDKLASLEIQKLHDFIYKKDI